MLINLGCVWRDRTVVSIQLTHVFISVSLPPCAQAENTADSAPITKGYLEFHIKMQSFRTYLYFGFSHSAWFWDLSMLCVSFDKPLYCLVVFECMTVSWFPHLVSWHQVLGFVSSFKLLKISWPRRRSKYFICLGYETTVGMTALHDVSEF